MAAVAKVVVAPDKFKFALTARRAAAAIRRGVLDAVPAARVIALPMADGGEGSGEILARSLGASTRHTRVLNPRGRRIRARWWYDNGTRHAIIEMAAASGLSLLPRRQRNPLRCSSYGTGQLLMAALRAGARRITLCVGGSATVDGGAGCIQALGWELRRRDGRPIDTPIVAAQLAEITSITPADRKPVHSPASLTILVDVDNPLLGRSGAAAVFAPQKGAARADILRLERGLNHWCRLLEAMSGRKLGERAGAGAAGGLPAGLLAAWPDCRVEGGAAAIASQLGLPEALRGAALCLTGEGRLDNQSVRGKVVSVVARLANEARVPAIALVGRAEIAPMKSTRREPRKGVSRHSGLAAIATLEKQLGLRSIIEISPPGPVDARTLRRTPQNLRKAARAWLRACQRAENGG